MREHHLDEETLNLLLDGELSAQERRLAESHLATCPSCRAELRMLQVLCTALDAMALEPAPDLVPGVVAQIQRRRRLRPAWLLPALQGLCALALLAWSWARLTGYWTAVAGFLSPQALEGTLTAALAWAAAQWAAVATWPAATRQALRQWSDWMPGPSGHQLVPLHPGQTALWAAPVVVLWLLANAVLLRRARRNGRA